MASRKQLTADEFETIRPYLEQFAEKNIGAIRSVMVDGRQQKDVARELKMTKSTVSAMVVRAWELHVEHGDRPEGWEVVNLALPHHMAAVVKDMALKAREQLKGSR